MIYWRYRYHAVTAVICILTAVRLSVSSLTESVLDKDTNQINVISDVVDGNFLMEGFFGVHFANYSTSNYCGKINKQSLIQVEAMRYAIKRLNKIFIAYGKAINYRIVDSCRNTATLRRSFFDANQYYYIGTVGPPTSDEAAVVATVRSAGRSAVISPTASSMIFEDRFAYYNFFRAIPSDVVQINVFVDVCLHFNWTYVSVVNSYGLYGQQLVENFINSAESKGICIAKRNQLPKDASDADFDKVVETLVSEKNANIVLLFTSTADTKRLLSADTKRMLQAARPVNRLTWFATTSWSAADEFISNVKNTANGALILQYSNMADKDFERYFLNLTLQNNNYTWFREFWGDEFNCNAGLPNDTRPKCTGTEKLDGDKLSLEHLPINPVIGAVESFACAIYKIILKLCGTIDLNCIGINLDYTYNFETGVVSTLTAGESKCENYTSSMKFNKEGYVYRDIKVLNYDGYTYKDVGIWSRHESSNEGVLNMSVQSITWNINKQPTSICSTPCESDEIKQPASSRPKCCFSCEKCPDNSIIVNNTCKLCKIHHLADLHNMECRPMPTRHIEFTRSFGLVTMALLSIGLLLNTFVLVVFIKKRNLRVVKASSKELSFIIIMGLFLCFICPCMFLVKPSKITCGAQRFIVGLSLTGCYTPLMLKTNRIYRIFTAAKALKVKPALVSPKSQIFICIGLLGLQLLLGIMWVIAEVPETFIIPFKHNTEVAEICKSHTFNFILNLLPCLVMMTICTVYAFKTRKFPSNFNEAQSIVITMYISCFVWGIFVPLIVLLEHLKTNDPFRLTFVIANFPIIIGLVTLIGLFGSKIKQLLCFRAPVQQQPERFSEFHGDALRNRALTLNNDQALYTISEMKISNENDTIEIARKDVGTNT